MAKLVKMPISTARRRLFELADFVRRSGDETVVVLEQRGGVEPVAMVREARLVYLEDRVMQLERAERKPFVLAGSLSSNLDDGALEQAMRQLREDWRAPVQNSPGTARAKKPSARPGRPAR